MEPFSTDEMVPLCVQPGFPGAPSRTIWHAPVTPRENLLQAIRTKECLFLPNVLDMRGMNPAFLLDNRARGTVMDGGDPFVPDPAGESDVFGVEWLYDPAINGSMVRPGAPLLEDIEDWEETIVFPDPSEWDWAGQAEASREYLSDPLYARKSTIFTGFFERLISFMDFEDAAIAMVDEDAQEDVHALFARLTDLYITYLENFKQHFDIDVLEVHDDWGSQTAPLLSESTIREMVLPYLARLISRAHELGVAVEFHSCGKIECLVPLMVEAGVDLWMGQDVNDKKAVVDAWGDKLIMEVEVPELGADATDEEVWAAAEAFAEDFIIPGKPVALSIYSAGRANPPLLTEALYQISRKKLCGSAEDANGREGA